MIAHCTAAALGWCKTQRFSMTGLNSNLLLTLLMLWLVSENKVLCHPSSVDSLSTSAATEDHVSMGGWAARKALRVIEHVEQGLLNYFFFKLLYIELFV